MGNNDAFGKFMPEIREKCPIKSIPLILPPIQLEDLYNLWPKRSISIPTEYILPVVPIRCEII